MWELMGRFLEKIISSMLKSIWCKAIALDPTHNNRCPTYLCGGVGAPKMKALPQSLRDRPTRRGGQDLTYGRIAYSPRTGICLRQTRAYVIRERKCYYEGAGSGAPCRGLGQSPKTLPAVLGSNISRGNHLTKSAQIYTLKTYLITTIYDKRKGGI
jgi:hypothetical protein